MNVCLVMIVRNEERVLARCLRSLRNLVDCAVIVDTGSDDRTSEVARDTLERCEVRAHILHHDWVDFPTNRTLALDAARDRFPEADYLLMPDADEIYSTDQLEPLRGWPAEFDGSHDCYEIMARYGWVALAHHRLIRASKPFRYAGPPVHEKLTCDETFTIKRLPGILVTTGQDGARCRAEKATLENDLLILRSYLRKQPLCSRTYFYLGRTLQGLGRFEQAHVAYLNAASLTDDAEAHYVALLDTAKVAALISLGADAELPLQRFHEFSVKHVDTMFRDASRATPNRAEALFHWMRYFRATERPVPESLRLEWLTKTVPPDARLFVELNAYPGA
jgi:glycosyltransferase involved in cell wall biosynthesis